MNDYKDYQGMANTLYDAYEASGHDNYMVERIKKYFYGRMVKDHIGRFNTLHDLLVLNDHDKNNPYVYGDYDVGVWYEKYPDQYTKVLATTRYCSCADDNTHIYVLKDISEPGFEGLHRYEYITFLCATAWPRQINESRSSHQWGDHRDIKHPSINTFRRHNFKYGYQDGRDDHYCFKYESMNDSVEDANWNEGRILWALDTLRGCYEEMIYQAMKLEPTEKEKAEYGAMMDGMLGLQDND
jgi:hypothetical protein